MNNRFVKIFFVQLTIVIGTVLVTGEVYLRLLNENDALSKPLQLREKSLTYQPSVFARHIFPQKKQQVTSKAWYVENNITPQYIINDMGYRGESFSIEKPDGVIRVMIYGGSSVFGVTSTQGKDWPTLVEEIFKQDGIKNIEVINAGVPGHASFDSYGRMFAEGHHFKPDFVILYNEWNDIKRAGSNKSLLRDIAVYNPKKNKFLYYNNQIDKTLSSVSKIYLLFRQKYYFSKYQAGLEGASSQKVIKIDEKALEQYRLNLQMFVDCARNIGAQPILMTEGRLVSENPPKEGDWINTLSQYMTYEMAHQAFVKHDAIIKNVAKNKDVPFIDAGQLLQENDEYLFFDHVHLLDEGSTQLAHLVKNKLLKLINGQQK